MSIQADQRRHVQYRLAMTRALLLLDFVDEMAQHDPGRVAFGLHQFNAALGDVVRLFPLDGLCRFWYPRTTMNDPRGPVRQIKAIEERSDATLLTLSCGHVGRFNQIFHYKIGEDCRCVRCLDEETTNERHTIQT
jgi:hypothetical protein